MKKKHQKVIDALNENSVPYKDIYFHGSRARGDNKNSSDWDYLVVLDDSEKKNYLDHVLLITRIKPFPKCDLEPCLKSDFENSGSVAYWAKKEGYSII